MVEIIIKNFKFFLKFEVYNIGKYEYFFYKIIKKYLIWVNRVKLIINLFLSN